MTAQSGQSLPRWLAQVNRRALNPIVRLFAGRLPWFAVVAHAGRRSGRTYRTPVNAFRVPGGYVIAVSYGRESDWVRNVLAAGGCVLETAGLRVCATDPRLFRDPRRALVPPLVRVAMRLTGVDEFLALTPRSAPSASQRCTDDQPAAGS